MLFWWNIKWENNMVYKKGCRIFCLMGCFSYPKQNICINTPDLFMRNRSCELSWGLVGSLSAVLFSEIWIWHVWPLYSTIRLPPITMIMWNEMFFATVSLTKSCLLVSANCRGWTLVTVVVRCLSYADEAACRSEACLCRAEPTFRERVCSHVSQDVSYDLHQRSLLTRTKRVHKISPTIAELSNNRLGNDTPDGDSRCWERNTPPKRTSSYTDKFHFACTFTGVKMIQTFSL